MTTTPLSTIGGAAALFAHQVPDRGPLETMLPADVAERLGVSESCLAKWRMVGKGPPFVKVSHRRVVYPVPAFNSFLADRIRTTTIEPVGAEST